MSTYNYLRTITVSISSTLEDYDGGEADLFLFTKSIWKNKKKHWEVHCYNIGKLIKTAKNHLSVLSATRD